MNYGGKKFGKRLEKVFILEFLRKNRKKIEKHYEKLEIHYEKIRKKNRILIFLNKYGGQGTLKLKIE